MVATALSKVSEHKLAATKFKASGWTAGHLQHTIEVLKKKHPDKKLVIFQPSFSTTVELSAGSHDFDGVFDVWIEGMTGGVAQRFLRSQGWAAWHRHTGKFKNNIHIHMATIPPGLPAKPTPTQVGAAYKKLGLKVGHLIDGGVTENGRVTHSSQIVDYYKHAFGLADQHTAGSDKSWFPPDISKTIYQPEDDMTKEEMLQVLKSKEGQEAIAKAVVRSKIHGQAGEPDGGRMVGASITGIYNLLTRIAKKIGA